MQLALFIVIAVLNIKLSYPYMYPPNSRYIGKIPFSDGTINQPNRTITYKQQRWVFQCWIPEWHTVGIEVFL